MVNDFEHIPKIQLLLEDFVNSHRYQLEVQASHLYKDVFFPLNKLKTRTIKGNKAFKVLTECSEIAFEFLQKICIKHSIDFWLAIIRRLPRLIPNWEKEWITYSHLAIIKWSDWNKDTTFGQVKDGNDFGIALFFKEEDLFDCCKIAALGKILHQVNVLRRWIGKGAKIIHKGIGEFEPFYPENVKQAVFHYERQRPEFPLFADEGFLLNDAEPFPNVSDFAQKPFYMLGSPKLPGTSLRAVLEESGQEFLLDFFLRRVIQRHFVSF